MPLRSIHVLSFLAIVMSSSALPAYAYLDPGTGSMILQLLLGGVAGIALAGKLYWHRLLVAIGVRSEAPEETQKPRADR